jgi:hypothetical protein
MLRAAKLRSYWKQSALNDYFPNFNAPLRTARKSLLENQLETDRPSKLNATFPALKKKHSIFFKDFARLLKSYSCIQAPCVNLRHCYNSFCHHNCQYSHYSTTHEIIIISVIIISVTLPCPTSSASN